MEVRDTTYPPPYPGVEMLKEAPKGPKVPSDTNRVVPTGQDAPQDTPGSIPPPEQDREAGQGVILEKVAPVPVA